ncbi:MAG: hypothetical protein NT010_15915 [Proteobacteria bacterium]|nr:hypothetical protein [Pseudomonadota bacterium]
MKTFVPDLTPEYVLKERTIKVRYFYGGGETREVSEEEAKTIVSETYNNTYGGLIVDMKTNKVIEHINADVEEIMVVEGDTVEE